jgi:hypothetical protein
VNKAFTVESLVSSDGDFVIVRKALIPLTDVPKFPTIQRHLTGGLKYDDAGRLYRDTAEEIRSYVGNTSEVHDAWKVFDAGE